MQGGFLVRDTEHQILAFRTGVPTLTAPGLLSPYCDPCTYPPAKSSKTTLVSALFADIRRGLHVGSCSRGRNQVEVVMVNERACRVTSRDHLTKTDTQSFDGRASWRKVVVVYHYKVPTNIYPSYTVQNIVADMV